SLPALGLNVFDLENADVILCSREGIEAVQDRLRRTSEKAVAGASSQGGGPEGPGSEDDGPEGES
ncbi:MAG: hypothetical protein V3T44_04985, partial [bacterium]